MANPIQSPNPSARNAFCSIEGCGRPTKAHGWCSRHYRRWRRHGDPSVCKKTPNDEARRYYEDIVLAYRGTECLMWPYDVDRHGYARMMIQGRNKSVARLTCEHANGLPPTPNHDAAHSCGRGHMGCVATKHLRWATRKENVADTLEHGTRNRGSRNGRSKLIEAEIIEIRRLQDQMTQQSLAGRFGVSRHHISNIVNRRSWDWLEQSALEPRL